MRFVISALILVFLCPLDIKAGGFETFVQDIRYFFGAPARMTRADGLRVLGFSGLVTTVMFVADEPIDRAYGGRDRRFPFGLPRTLSRVGNWYNKPPPGVFILGISGSSFLMGVFLDDARLVQTAGLMVESVVILKLLEFPIKRGFGRSRPYRDKGARDFHWLKHNEEATRSMPSGHTSTLFSVATVVSQHYDRWWVTAPVYTFALAVSFQRIDSRNHWTSDVLIGAMTGYIVGKTLVNRRREQSDGIVPMIRFEF